MAESGYFDGAYRARNPDWHSGDSPHKAQWILSLLNDHKLSPSTVCEVGCGAGEILVRLQSEMGPAIRFTGYDISPDAAAINHPKRNKNLQFLKADILISETERFDLLLLIDVFEHVEDYLSFLRKLRDRASRFVFHIPLDLHVSSLIRVGPLLDVRYSVGHLHYFTRETALAALADTGYRIVDERFMLGALESPQTGIRSRLARIHRRIAFKIAPVLAARWLGGFSLLVLAEPAK